MSNLKDQSSAREWHLGSVTKWLLLALLLTVSSGFTGAQTVAPFMGLGNAQFFDNNGQALTSGVLYSFQAGTTTQQATYTDATGLVSNPNPIPFGSGARVGLWLLASSYYKFVLCLQNDGPTCAPADVLFSVDQVPGSPRLISVGSTFTGTFISGTSTPATTGILRLASADVICWRNTANTANLCISKDANDVLQWSGGTLKMPEVSCSGNGASFDYICADSSTHHWKFTGNGSGQLIIPGIASAGVAGNFITLAANGIDFLDSNISSTNPSFSSVVINGVTYSSPPSAANLCLISSSTTVAAWNQCSYSFYPPQRATLGSNLGFGSTLQTTVLSETVVFPSTPASAGFRANISYTLWMQQGANVCMAEVIDTTNNRVFAGSGRNSNGTGYEGMQGTEISTQLYAAGSSAIFTLQVECNAASTATVNMTNGALFTMSPAEPTYLSVTPVLTN